MKEIISDVKTLESRLGLPMGFYDSLLDEDDWSFVIKFSSLFEAASSHILSIRLNAPEIESALGFLEQANSRCGKIVLLEKLGVILLDQKKFMVELATLRNNLVHNISNITFDFEEFIKGFNKNQEDKFVQWVGHGINEEIHIADESITRKQAVLQNPKLCMWITGAEVLACLYLEVPKSDAIKFMNQTLEKYLERKGTEERG